MKVYPPPVLAGPAGKAFVYKVNQAPEEIGAVALMTQAAAITTTAIPTSTLTEGRYQVTTYARITRAATVSSSLTVTVGWTDGGVSCTQAFTALTGNTTATVQSQSVMVTADAGTSITYAAAYASTGATAMQFALAVVVEQRP